MCDSQAEGNDGAGPVDKQPSEDDRPRLRLHHLFVLTAVMAVLLAINGPQRSLEGANYQPPPLQRTLWLAVGISHTILSAAAITALGYGIAAYRRGRRFFDQPGHWLLVEISLTSLIGIVPSVGYRLIGNEQMMYSAARMAIAMILTGYSLLFLVMGRLVINTYLGNTKCDERRWKFVFYTKALGSVLFGLGGLLIIPTVIHALRADRREHVRRDAGHQCGAALQLALSGLTLITGAVMVYNFVTVFQR